MKTAVVGLEQAKEMAERRDISGSFKVDLGDKKIKFGNEDDAFFLKRGKREYQLQDTSFRSLLTTLELPLALQKKIEGYPDLLSHNLNYMASRKGGAIRALRRGKSIIGFTEPDKIIIPNQDVINTLEEALGKDALVEKFNIGKDSQLDINVANGDTKSKLKVAKGDYFQSGVHIANSPFGIPQQGTTTSVEGYLMRLVCSNGAIGHDTVFKAPTALGDDHNEWLKATVKDAMETTSDVFAKIKDLKDKKIHGDPIVFLSNIFDELRISDRLQNHILYRLGDEGADNMYDLFNHMTYTASHNSDIRANPDIRNRLMRASTHYVDHVQNVCGSCNRPQVTRE